MWQKLEPAEQAKFLGMAMMSMALVAIAAAIGYFAYAVYIVQQRVPELLTQVEHTTERIDPVLQRIDAIRDLVPPILEEVRKTRESLPGLMDRAERLVAGAAKAGHQASEGATVGIFTGIIKAPFKLIGGVRRGLASAMGIEGDAGLTEVDDKRVSAAIDAVIRSGEIGREGSWENPDSKNRGTVRLLSQQTRDGQPCFRLGQTVTLASGKTYSAEVEYCQQDDGSWAHSKP